MPLNARVASLSFALLVGVGALLSVVDAQAQDARTKLRPKEKPMTRAELRECMKEKESNGNEKSAIEKERQGANEERAGVTKDREAVASDTQRITQELKELREKVDTNNPEAVDAYNAQATSSQKAVDDRRAALDARIDNWNKRNQALSQREATYNDAVKSWNDTCGSRAFREADEKAIKAGK
jgi:uncharacterized protein (DUF3084 family)